MCGAKKTTGPGTCTHPAGLRTNHYGEGKCWLHGGASRVTHGRYSKINHARLRELIKKYEDDPDPLNIMPELAMVRALLTDFIERYQIITDALLGWWASWVGKPLSPDLVHSYTRVVDELEALLTEQGRTDDINLAIDEARALIERLTQQQETRPKQIIDISDAYRMAAEVTKIWERMLKVQLNAAISRERLMQITQHMGRVVETHVDDKETLEKIKEGWLDVVI